VRFQKDERNNISVISFKEDVIDNNDNADIGCGNIIDKELILDVNNKNSLIKKELFINNKTIIISKIILNKLTDSKFIIIIDCVIFDIQLYNFKKTLKHFPKYIQISKQYIKYYKSVYSSKIYKDKPLIKLPIENIDRILYSRKIPAVLTLHLYIKFNISNIINKDFPFCDKLDFISDERGHIVELICDEEEGNTLIKLLNYLKSLF
jgi:hypothetical protein